MDFLDPKLDEYVHQHTSAASAALQQLDRETWVKVPLPVMLAGHLQGQVLQMLSHMLRPKLVLEVGTYTGYSAICWAQGLAEGGQVHTIDINEELEDMVRQYFDRAGVAEKVTLHIGNALDIIPSIAGEFDLVYIDADKPNYAHYYDQVIDRVRPGGFIIADNVLWSGKVLDLAANQDEDTRALAAYSAKIHADERVENVLLPIRDGLMVARKLG